jgi:hypothetical protein
MIIKKPCENPYEQAINGGSFHPQNSIPEYPILGFKYNDSIFIALLQSMIIRSIFG